MEKEEVNMRVLYEEQRKKHVLPEWEKLIVDFDAEKLSDKETSFILREVRRIMNEKLSAYLHLFESLINPNNPPMFVLSIIRKIGTEDKETIKELYRILASLQLKAMKLDTVYSEQGEAEFINSSFNEWQKLKQQVLTIINDFDSSFEEELPRDRGYYG